MKTAMNSLINVASAVLLLSATLSQATPNIPLPAQSTPLLITGATSFVGGHLVAR